MRLPKTQVEPFIAKNLKMPLRQNPKNASKDTDKKYSKSNNIPSPTSSNKLHFIICKLWSNNLIRWLLLVAILLVIFVLFSNYVGQPSIAHKPYLVTEIPELDFNLANLISASIGLSTLAAEAVVGIKNEHKEEIRIKGQTKEGVDEPVTKADYASNSLIINGFKTLFSHSKSVNNENGHNKIHLQLISEETSPKYEEVVPILEYIEIGDKNVIGDKLLDPERISIIIDPLDATKEYTEEYDVDHTFMLPWVTILICIVEDGHPIAGIVNRPFAAQEDIIWAVVETQEIHGMPRKNGEIGGDIAVSRSHGGGVGDIVEKYVGKKVVKVGGSGYKMFMVVGGEVDAYLHSTNIHTWDVCAGHALVKAVGGNVVDKDGVELEYLSEKLSFRNGLIASLDEGKNRKYAKILKDAV